MNTFITNMPSFADAVISTETTAVVKSEAGLYVVLYDGYSVTKLFFDLVLHHVESKIPTLNQDQKYTLEDICGGEFWSQLGRGDCIIAGRCMSHMVLNDFVSLRPAESKHEYPKYYRIK